MRITRRTLLTGLGCSLGTWALPGCSRQPIKARPVPAGATVLALGDSLTFGTGAAPDASYPAVLSRLSGWNVINAGVPSDTSAQALARVQPLLEEHKPALVLLCIGGNDLLRRLDEAALRGNIERICQAASQASAQVLLLAVPGPTLAAKFTGSLSDHPLYGELAEALKLPLHRQGWSEVLAEERLRADAIHANAAGYEQFARGLLATLRTTGMLSA
jgi:acyl-CoA thioesterase I